MDTRDLPAPFPDSAEAAPTLASPLIFFSLASVGADTAGAGLVVASPEIVNPSGT